MVVLRRRSSEIRPIREGRDTELFKKGAVKGARLPPSQWLLREDDHCPLGPSGQCGDEIGHMLVTPDGDCSCHINPPCSACIDSLLRCSSCGFKYRGTVEDNVEVQFIFNRNQKNLAKRVDTPTFALYDIYGAAPKRSKPRTTRLIKKVD